MKYKDIQETLISPESIKGYVHFFILPQVLALRLKLLNYLLDVSTLKIKTDKSHSL